MEGYIYFGMEGYIYFGMEGYGREKTLVAQVNYSPSPKLQDDHPDQIKQLSLKIRHERR